MDRQFTRVKVRLSPEPLWQRDTKVRCLFQLILSGLYMTGKYTLTPCLYLFRRMGLSPTLPNQIDAFMNRMVLPLTERPDKVERMDILPTIKTGELLHAFLSEHSASPLGKRMYAMKGRPLLLVFIRGSWCSYSRLHMSHLQAHAPGFEAMGVQLAAITSDKDISLWKKRGISIPIWVDKEGALFKALGILKTSWTDYAWGRVLPHESVFLFDSQGRLVFSDIRKISAFRMQQTFLDAPYLLERCRAMLPTN